MANPSVRRLDEDTLKRLRLRAAERGVSVEEEVRRILRDAVNGPERVGDLALALFGDAHGVELDLPVRTVDPPPDFTS
jgi:plasmid stability protein